jgi:hypothetical protein
VAVRTCGRESGQVMVRANQREGGSGSRRGAEVWLQYGVDSPLRGHSRDIARVVGGM